MVLAAKALELTQFSLRDTVRIVEAARTYAGPIDTSKELLMSTEFSCSSIATPTSSVKTDSEEQIKARKLC